MKVFEAIYGMGGIETGGYFRSLIAANNEENITGLLCEEHDEEVLITRVKETSQTTEYQYERVFSTKRV
ncbi:hypothetical protein [Paenibacillus glucanolyticus]|uniref:hypothetical protein n=1 Tax=Paenibacillus glucanolyticus TaxID=59843 RepID=UPI00096FDD81|nr:hypothetical protein [Paenibacillus glucanolyticus]OMF76658.1 hypothetical protein BK142_14130 [Paenibacillus glucanolyticus]